MNVGGYIPIKLFLNSIYKGWQRYNTLPIFSWVLVVDEGFIYNENYMLDCIFTILSSYY